MDNPQFLSSCHFPLHFSNRLQLTAKFVNLKKQGKIPAGQKRLSIFFILFGAHSFEKLFSLVSYPEPRVNISIAVSLIICRT